MSNTLTCAYCGATHPAMFFYLRDNTDDPDPACWGCSDDIERGTLAPHYPDDRQEMIRSVEDGDWYGEDETT